MNRITLALLIASLSILLVVPKGTVEADNTIDRADGFIGFTGASGKKVLSHDLASRKIEDLFTIEGYAAIHGFDVSRDMRTRVMGLNDEGGERIELFKDGKPFKTLVDHRHVRWPVFSPDGKRVAYVRSTHAKDSSMDWYLHTVNIDGSSDRQVSPRSLQQMRPSWFPDGKRVAVGSRDLVVYVIDLVSGTERKIIDFGMAPTVSHDGTKIAYLSKETSERTKRRLREYMASKDLKEYYARTSQQELMELGRLLYYESIYVYDLTTGKSTKLTKEMPLEEPVVWAPDDRRITFNDHSTSMSIHILDLQTGKSQEIPGTHGRVMTWTDRKTEN